MTATERTDCGCRVSQEHDSRTRQYEDGIHYCPIHAAAPATAALLKEALGVIEECLDQLEWCQKDHASDDQYAGRIEKAKALLARAKAVGP